MRDLIDVDYSASEGIRVVLNNQSNHSARAIYETFDAVEVDRILRRLETYYTPKHASWLNRVEIEVGVMVSQCLALRIPSKKILAKEVKAGERRRNRDKSRITWLFNGRPSSGDGRSSSKPASERT